MQLSLLRALPPCCTCACRRIQARRVSRGDVLQSRRGKSTVTGTLSQTQCSLFPSDLHRPKAKTGSSRPSALTGHLLPRCYNLALPTNQKRSRLEPAASVQVVGLIREKLGVPPSWIRVPRHVWNTLSSDAFPIQPISRPFALHKGGEECLSLLNRRMRNRAECGICRCEESTGGTSNLNVPQCGLDSKLTKTNSLNQNAHRCLPSSHVVASSVRHIFPRIVVHFAERLRKPSGWEIARHSC